MSGASATVASCSESPYSSQRVEGVLKRVKKGIENEEESSRLYDAVDSSISLRLCGNFFDGSGKIKTGRIEEAGGEANGEQKRQIK